MRLFQDLLSPACPGRSRRPARRRILLPLLPFILLAGCAGPPPAGRPAPDRAPGEGQSWPIAADLAFVTVYENVRDAAYFPVEGIAGVVFAQDGTLIFCDEKGGRIHALDPVDLTWYQFDSPGNRFFRPLDVRVDQFNILVLDADGPDLLRYELGGVFLDRLVDFTYLDPGYRRRPVAFDVDVDGRMAFADPGEEQIVLLDEYLSLNQSVGGPGSHDEQFSGPSGVAFLDDGGFVVADRGNRRLQRFNRLGYLVNATAGEFDRDNPLITPQGVAVDPYGNIFVADPVAGAIHAYDEDLRHLFTLGSELGLLASPEAPIDLAVGPDDILAVTDRSRQALLIYRIEYR